MQRQGQGSTLRYQTSMVTEGQQHTDGRGGYCFTTEIFFQPTAFHI